MEVRAGYKQTEVGVIPEEWEVVSLSEFVTEFRGGAPLKPSDFTNSGVKVLPKGGVGRTGWLKIEARDIQFCSHGYADAHRNNQVDKGHTIVVLRDLVPSGPSIGLIVQINDAETYVLAQGVYGFKVNEEADPRFLTQLSNTRWYRRLMNSIMVGSTQVHITNTAFKRVKIPLPNLPEQRAIAAALSDVDGLLGGLDRLIAKKRDLKQAAMQQLLTGQTRLPGFHGDWEVNRLGEVSDVKTGPFGSTLHESDYVQEGTPIITVEHLGNFGVEHTNLPLVSDSDCKRLAAYSLEVGDIVFSRVGSVDRNALIRPAEEGWLFSGRLLRVRSNKRRIFAPFLSYQFHGETFVSEVRNVAVGQTMACLNTQILKGIRVFLPAVPEQIAIAEVLTDMDAELLALEQRREKTRALKQAMMQELLTGRTRLV
ncbi:MAG: restriction endonuclease subunit S [Pseudomonadota bacterium]